MTVWPNPGATANRRPAGQLDGSDNLSEALSTDWLRPTLVDVTLPTFSMRCDFNLVSALERLGIADFSGINGARQDLLINAVLHQTYIDVNDPAAGKAGIASRVTIEHHWTGVPESSRWASSA